MDNNEYNITVNKKTENIENNEINKNKKLKHKNPNFPFSIINEEKDQYIKNYKNKFSKDKYNNNEFLKENYKRNNNEKIFVIQNDNDIMTYFSKSRNNNRFSVNYSNSKPKQKTNITDNIDLIYILSTKKRENENTLEDSEQLTSFIGIPFCHYHRFNDQLPKQYICNYKNCNCYECVDMGKCQNLNDNKNKPDYIYPINKTKKRSFKYRSVLDKYKKNKNISSLSEDANQLGSFCLNILKPNDTNIKISKKNYIDENNIFGKENEYSLNESSFLELPFDCNDDKNLKNYQNLVSKTDKKSKIHFSVMYYKKLNKSYNQVYSKDL